MKPEPDIRTMAIILAALGKGITDDVACVEALRWARYSDDHIVRYCGLARQLARNFCFMQQQRCNKRERLGRPA
jgi:hypothetical protein